MPNGYLIHYASEYYDPVKAHEYYMQHRKLKGRSTAKLNDTGKEAAEYVKSQLQAEREKKVAASKENMESQIESSKTEMQNTISKSKTQMENEVNTHKENMESKISILNARIKSLKGANSESRTLAIRKEIQQLRNENAAKKAELQEAYSATSTEARSAHKTNTANARSEHKTNTAQYKTDYENAYADELDKLLSDSSMLKSSSSKKKSSSGITGSSKSLQEISSIMKDYKKKNKK